MSANRQQASLLSWIVVVIAAVIGILLFAVMWLRPQLGDAGEVWKPINDQVSNLLEVEEQSASANSEVDKNKRNMPASDSSKAAPENGSNGSSGEIKDKQQNAMNQQPGEQGVSQNKETKQTAVESSQSAHVAPGTTANDKVQQNQLISLNSADEKRLDELPGVGPSKAKAIIAYREKHGKFNTVDELMKVKGIGPKMFAKMKDKITVD